MVLKMKHERIFRFDIKYCNSFFQEERTGGTYGRCYYYYDNRDCSIFHCPEGAAQADERTVRRLCRLQRRLPQLQLLRGTPGRAGKKLTPEIYAVQSHGAVRHLTVRKLKD